MKKTGIEAVDRIPPIENPFNLNGRVAIVTGGSRGIGAECAFVLAKHGCNVVAVARSVDDLTTVAQEINAKGNGKCVPMDCDVCDESKVGAMVEQTLKIFGRIDVLVNNAGGSPLQPLETVKAEKFDRIVSLNMRAPFLCTQAVGPHMREGGGGSIVNISSGAGVTGVRGGAAYSGAKAGLQMFSKVVANEWGRFNIRSNCIAVGVVASEAPLKQWVKFQLDVDEMGKSVPLGRVGVPEDIAYPVLFLASDASRFVTGTTITADGGPQMPGIPEV